MRNTLSLLLAVALLLAWALPAHADAPQTMHFQGYLKDAAGDPVDGSVDMVFAIYDAESGGAALWTEAHAAVPVDDGVYSVVLGSTTPLDLEWDDQYYVGVTVASDAEMTPRMALASAPYAMNRKVKMVLGRDASGGYQLNGETVFKLDSIDVNTATEEVSIDSGTGEITILKGGFYRIYFQWAVDSVSGSVYASLATTPDGANAFYSVAYYRSANNADTHNFDVILYFSQNDSFYVRNCCSGNFVSSGLGRSLLSITYLGD